MIEYDVSVLVATYNPNKEKIFLTLASIICQKNVKVQVVITDDGSQENYFREVEAWFNDNDFKDYELVVNEKNCGTVKNVSSGLYKCKGKYVKPISPADMLANEILLKRWIEEVERYGVEWSFSDAIYYKSEKGNIVPINAVAHPQSVSVYIENNINKIANNYLIYGDICLGAATLCKRKTMEKYMSMIIDKVVYAEDNMYRIMMADNVSVHFYYEDAILYEIGEGVSTSKSDEWARRLKKDWDAADAIICEKISNYAQEYKKIINKIKRLMYSIKYKIMPRETSISIDEEYINKLYGLIDNI